MRRTLAKAGISRLWRELPGVASATQQAFAGAGVPCPMPVSHAAGWAAVSYLVAYEGATEDLNLWHDHYMAVASPIMRAFPHPADRDLQRIDWVGFLPLRRWSTCSATRWCSTTPGGADGGVEFAVRHEMREDFHKFPPFGGRTRIIRCIHGALSRSIA